MKFTLTLFGILIHTFISAQIIQNRGFETWLSDSTICPSFFQCTNEQTFPEHSFQPVKRTTNARSGNYAISLETHITSTDTFFGYFLKGDVDNQTGGFAYGHRPDSVVGYANYDVKPGDTALILAIFLRSGTPIGNCIGTFVGTQTSYTRFSFPIEWQGPQGLLPDSMIYAAASSNAINEIGIVHGSTLTLDDIEFKGQLTVPNPPNNGFENWDFINRDRPANWSSYLDFPYGYQFGLVNKLSATNSNSGDAAIEIKTDIIQGDTLLGYLANYNDERPGGYAYSKQLDTLTGFYKFQSPSVDSGTAYVTLHKGLQEYSAGVRLPPVSDYTEFNLPFNCPFVPDSIRIAFIAGTDLGQNSIVKGSTFWLDDLSFKKCSDTIAVKNFVGDTSFCSLDSLVHFEVSKDIRIRKFNWSMPKGFDIISNPDSSFINVILNANPDSISSGQIVVEPQIECGIPIALVRAIHVDTNPSTPTVINLGYGGLLASSFAERYVWYMNGVVIPDSADMRRLNPPRDKVYFSVKAFTGNCPSGISDEIYFAPGSVQEKNETVSLTIYPNPTKELITLKFNGIYPMSEFEIKIISPLGKVIMRSSNQTTLNLTPIPEGVYNVQVINGTDMYSERLVKY